MSTTAPNAGNALDAVIYQEEFFGAMTEVLQEEANIFNGASNGALRLVSRSLKGDFEKESFLQIVSGIIRDRDPDSNAVVTSKKMTMDELIHVKVNKAIGPVDQTLDFWRKIGSDPSEMSYALGEQAGKAAAIDFVTYGVSALVAALRSDSNVVYDAVTSPVDGQTGPSARHLNAAMAQFGDKSNRIVAWLMNGTTYHNLVDKDIADKVDGVAASVIYGGTPGTLGKPVIVTDNSSLSTTDFNEDTIEDDSRNFIVGLVAGAAEVAQSEEQIVTMQDITGHENLVRRMQGEYAYNVGVRGYAYTGAKNPDLATLAASANWDLRMHDSKMGPGVLLAVA